MSESGSRLLLGLIGAGIQASRTPAMHEQEAREHGLHCLYQLIDIERAPAAGRSLGELLAAAESTGFAGLNITHPYKQAALPLLTRMSEEAAALGAVNTVVFRDGERIGHNTDWLAFAESLRDNAPPLRNGRIVQLGAGGAGAATAYAALRLGLPHVAILDIVEERAAALAARLGKWFGAGRAGVARDAASELQDAVGLIHATPTGMAGHPGLPLSPELLRPPLWVAEVVYFPIETELLRVARERGCRTIDGGGMAVRQAAEAFRLFTGKAPSLPRMREHFLTLGPRSA